MRRGGVPTSHSTAAACTTSNSGSCNLACIAQHDVRLKAREERNSSLQGALALASSCILSRNYLLLTGRSRKRSPSLASRRAATFISGRLSPSLSFYFSFFLSLTVCVCLSISYYTFYSRARRLLSRNHAHIYTRIYERTALTDAATLRALYNQPLLFTRPIFAKAHEHRVKTVHAEK